MYTITVYVSVLRHESISPYGAHIYTSIRGGSRAGSLGGAQQRTGGGGVVAEMFRDLNVNKNVHTKIQEEKTFTR